MQKRSSIEPGIHDVQGARIEVVAVEIFVCYVDGTYIASFRHRKDIVCRSSSSAERAVVRLLHACPDDVPKDRSVTVYGIGDAITDLERTFRHREVYPVGTS